MAKSLPETFQITGADPTGLPCEFCEQPAVADPDDLEAWSAHLTTVHGYRIEWDEPPKPPMPRTIRFRLAGWSPRAKFKPNDRVDVNDKAPGDYEDRRGTVVGWHAPTSEYAVRFDEYPFVGFLASHTLKLYTQSAAAVEVA